MPKLTATDELRKMLDELGVKWEARTSPTGAIWTYWDAFNGYRVYARDNENGTVKIFGEWDVTPEQAIAATLGHDQRNCRNISDFNPVDVFTCSECGSSFKVCQFKIDADGILDDETEFEFVPMHCPRCGAKVINE